MATDPRALGFTPSMQFQYAKGENTVDIALALDALEALIDDSAGVICIVARDSDYAPLCRKLRERSGIVCVVGRTDTPEPLRQASDHFFEWNPPQAQLTAAPKQPQPTPPKKSAAAQPRKNVPPAKQQPAFIVELVRELSTADKNGGCKLVNAWRPNKQALSGVSAQDHRPFDFAEVAQWLRTT